MLLWIHLLTADCTKKMRTLGRGGGLRLVSSSPMCATAANVGLILHWYHWCLPLHQTWLVGKYGKSPLQKSSKIRCLTGIDKLAGLSTAMSDHQQNMYTSGTKNLWNRRVWEKTLGFASKPRVLKINVFWKYQNLGKTWFVMNVDVESF